VLVRTAVGLSLAREASATLGGGLSAKATQNFCHESALSWAWLDGPEVSVAEYLPLYGSDLRASRVLVGGLAHICTPAAQLLAVVDAEKPLNSIRLVGPAKFRHLSLETLCQVARLKHQLDHIPTRNLHFGLGSKIAKAKAALANVDEALPGLKSLVSVGTAVGSSRAGSVWLIATQNLAEARGTGGILGSYAAIQVGPSGVHLQEAGSDKTLASYGPVDSSSLKVDTADIWGVEPKLWQDLNPSAHAPATAQQIYDSWLKYKHQRLSGVVFIGQGWAQTLVSLVGRLSFDGLALNGTNTADFLAKGIYARYKNVDEKNAAVSGIMNLLAKRLEAGSFDLHSFASSLAHPTTGDQLFAWSPEPVVEKRLVADGAAGYVDLHSGNRVYLAVNNGGGNKLDAYLHLSGSYTVSGTRVAGKRQTDSALNLRVANLAPTNGLPPYTNGRLDLPPGTKYQSGSNVDLVSVYLPIGAQPTGFFVNGLPYSAHDAMDRKHEVLSFRLELMPNKPQSIQITWHLSGAFAQIDLPKVISNSLFVSPIWVTSFSGK